MWTEIRLLIKLIPVAMVLSGCATMPWQEEPNATTANQALLPNSEIERALVESNAALETGDVETAYAGYSNILIVVPNHEGANLGMAECYLAMDRNSDAYDLFRTVQSSETLKGLSLQGQGLASIKMGKNDLARELLFAASEIDPTLWRSWNALGQIWDLEERWELSALAYDNAYRLMPGEAQIANNKGMSQFLQGDLDVALKHFEEAVALDPDLETAVQNRLVILALLGRYDLAVMGIDNVGLPQAFNNVGYIAMQRGEYKVARSYFTQSLDASATFYPKAEQNLRRVDYLLANE